jgi:hypothetical protein
MQVIIELAKLATQRSEMREGRRSLAGFNPQVVHVALQIP